MAEFKYTDVFGWNVGKIKGNEYFRNTLYSFVSDLKSQISVPLKGLWTYTLGHMKPSS